MKKIEFFKIAAILLVLAVVTAGCNKNVNDKTMDNEKFCSYVNEENIDKTIPIVNEFLSEISAEPDWMQQLQELATWLKSYPCIVDATVLGGVGSCGVSGTMMSEILVSFYENGITKKLILDVSQSQSFKAIGYHKYNVGEHDRMHSINLKEITEDNLIYVVYTSIAGNYTVEYEEYDNNTIKVNILYSRNIDDILPTCIIIRLSEFSIKKGIYKKAVISTFLRVCVMEDDCPDYMPIDSREISLKY